MHSVSISGATSAHVIHPSPYRAAVLGRRVRASESVSALLAELAYGAARDQNTALPSSAKGAQL